VCAYTGARAASRSGGVSSPYREPLRCTQCQRFDHHVTKCRSKPQCGVCSEEHLTDVCIQKIKNGTKLTAKCPNCGLGHHAWNPVCEERRKCLNIPPGLRSSRLKVHKVAQQLRPVSTNSPPSSSLHPPTRSYARAVTAAADASSPSASLIIPPRPSCHCNSQSDTTRDMEILTSILQMGLLLVGRQVDQQHVQALVSNVLAVSNVLSTLDGNQTSSTSSVNPSTLNMEKSTQGSILSSKTSS